MHHRFIMLVAGLGAAALSSTALAGTTLTYKSRDGATGMVYTIDGQRVSQENRAGDTAMLYDADTKTITTIDHGEKTYTVITEETRQRMQQQMAEAREQSRKALEQSVADLPAGARDKILKGTQAGVSAGQKGLSKGMEISVERTGRTDTVNGYECEEIHIRVMFSSTAACIADPAEVGMPADDAATMEKMNEGMREVSGSVMQGLGASMSGGPGLDGVAVRMTSDSTTWVLSDLNTGAVDATAFEVPEGYRQQEIMAEGN